MTDHVSEHTPSASSDTSARADLRTAKRRRKRVDVSKGGSAPKRSSLKSTSRSAPATFKKEDESNMEVTIARLQHALATMNTQLMDTKLKLDETSTENARLRSLADAKSETVTTSAFLSGGLSKLKKMKAAATSRVHSSQSQLIVPTAAMSPILDTDSRKGSLEASAEVGVTNESSDSAVIGILIKEKEREIRSLAKSSRSLASKLHTANEERQRLKESTEQLREERDALMVQLTDTNDRFEQLKAQSQKEAAKFSGLLAECSSNSEAHLSRTKQAVADEYLSQIATLNRAIDELRTTVDSLTDEKKIDALKTERLLSERNAMVKKVKSLQRDLAEALRYIKKSETATAVSRRSGSIGSAVVRQSKAASVPELASKYSRSATPPSGGSAVDAASDGGSELSVGRLELLSGGSDEFAKRTPSAGSLPDSIDSAGAFAAAFALTTASGGVADEYSANETSDDIRVRILLRQMHELKQTHAIERASFMQSISKLASDKSERKQRLKSSVLRSLSSSPAGGKLKAGIGLMFSRKSSSASSPPRLPPIPSEAVLATSSAAIGEAAAGESSMTVQRAEDLHALVASLSQLVAEKQDIIESLHGSKQVLGQRVLKLEQTIDSMKVQSQFETADGCKRKTKLETTTVVTDESVVSSALQTE